MSTKEAEARQVAFLDELTKIAQAYIKEAAAPPLLPGMRGPNPMIRAALGSAKASTPAIAGPSKLPGGLIAGKSIAGDISQVKGPSFKMQSLGA